MAGKIIGNTVKGLGSLVGDTVKDVAKEPGRIFEAATSAGSQTAAAGSSSPTARPVVASSPQPTVDRAREQDEINRLSQQINNKTGPAPKQPERRDVETEITQVRRKKETVEKDKQEELFLKELQEKREREQQEARIDAQEIIPQSKPSRGSALSPKNAGTKEMGKKRTG